MKRTLLILGLATATTASAEVGDVVNIQNLVYCVDGVKVSTQFDLNPRSGLINTNVYRAESARFYDSSKGAEWVGTYSNGTEKDSLLCWAHTSSNVIEYWQSYYGVFAKPQTGSYYDENGNFHENYDWQGNLIDTTPKPLPYGKVGTETANFGDTSIIPDSTQLSVARDLYYNTSNSGGKFGYATEWFFAGETDMLNSGGNFVINNPYTGGYYANYFDKGSTYTTVYSEYNATLSGNNDVKETFQTGSISELTQVLLPAFGLEKQADGTYKQTQAGMIVYLGLSLDKKNADGTITTTGHSVTCYGFTTDKDGNIATILIANSDDLKSVGSGITELLVQADGDRLKLYTGDDGTTPWLNTGGYYIGSVSYINTPEVLQNMLAEYKDVANEAQIWNGRDNTWESQVENTNELPPESTGWDINVNSDKIASEHQGYYHTYSTDGRAVVFGEEGADNKTITINGTVKTALITVSAAGYEFKAGENAAIVGAGENGKASLSLLSGASLNSDVALNLHNLSIESGAALTADTVVSVSGEFIVSLKEMQEAVTYNLRAATLGTNIGTAQAYINAALNLSAATSVVLETSVDMQGNALTFADKQALTLAFSSIGEEFLLFDNISTLTIGDVTYSATESASAAIDVSGLLVLQYEDHQPMTDYTLIFRESGLWLSVPEPTTATLSLLALAALTTRRRRN